MAAVDRAAIREWISTRGTVLETAQASGTLARTKLDVKDGARASLACGEPTPAFNALLEEELEAFCADMRLASTTIQVQVERKIHHNGRAALLAVIAAVVTLLVCAGNNTGPGVGFGLPILVGIGVFFAAR
jgi:hypothetical protein